MMNNTILYLECNSGISGDMTVAALLDLGADRQVLTDALESLPLSGYSVEIKTVFKSGIRACDFHVILDRAHENHDHDMEYLHGHSHFKEQGHGHEAHHNDTHHNDPDGYSHHGSHTHDARNLHDITDIISRGDLTEHAKALAIEIFEILAEAEASVHGKSVEDVHFHEVGAVDSIVDIVAAAVCIDNLAPSGIVVSPLTDGTGQIRCQHGLIPVPVPAVAAIAKARKLPLRITQIEGELVTPTGAAIAGALQSDTVLPETFEILKTGFGAGKREYATTGLLRAMLLKPVGNTENRAVPDPGDALPSSFPEGDTEDVIVTLETNIDDCTGEALSFTMDQLMREGALDVFFIPVYMKKNRPAVLLKVICEPQDQPKMEDIIFRNTTTIGIRASRMQRTKLKRRIMAVETPWGMADVKCCSHGEETYYYPENDSVCKLALQAGIGFSEMYSMIKSYVQKVNLYE